MVGTKKKDTTVSATRTRDTVNEMVVRNLCAMPITLTDTCSMTLLVSLTARRKKKKYIHNTGFALYSFGFPSFKFFRQGGPKTNVATLLLFFPP